MHCGLSGVPRQVSGLPVFRCACANGRLSKLGRVGQAGSFLFGSLSLIRVTLHRLRQNLPSSRWSGIALRPRVGRFPERYADAGIKAVNQPPACGSGTIWDCVAGAARAFILT